MGGSAWSAAREISDGFVTVTERTVRNLTVPQLNQLSHEVERLLRELRGGATTNEPNPEVQARQRRIQRLNSAMIVVRTYRLKTRK